MEISNHLTCPLGKPYADQEATVVRDMEQKTSSKWERNTRLYIVTLLQFSSVAQSCLALCDPMDCNTPGFPVHHQLPELAQTRVHQVSNAIQPSHPLSSPSPPFNLSQHQRISNESVLHIRWPKHWSFNFSIRYMVRCAEYIR